MNTNRYIISLTKIRTSLIEGLENEQKYYTSKGYYEECKNQIENWIYENDLEEELLSISSSSMFGTLFIECTPKLSVSLLEIPCIQNVFEDEKLNFSLI